MVQLEKERILVELERYIDLKGSQNKASKMLDISPASLSKIVARQWETISDSMWRLLGAKLGLGRTTWETVETIGYKKMTAFLDDAKYGCQVLGVVGSAGCGKTKAIKDYEMSNKDVYNISCSEYFSRKVFLGKLYQAMGGSPAGLNTAELVDNITNELKSKEYPLIVLDEADKLKDNVLQFLISLYNALDEQCGIILCATPFLEKRINRGVQNERCGYAEVRSRMGKKFQHLPQPSIEDVALICRANGLEDDNTIRQVYEDCEGDIRRVKRILFAIKKQNASQRGQAQPVLSANATKRVCDPSRSL